MKAQSMRIHILALSMVLFGGSLLASKALIAQDKGSLLWKVSGQGLEKPSYLFGTIHLICKDQMFMNETIETLFKNSDLVLMELDMDEPNMMMNMAMKAMNPGMKNFSEYLSDEDKKLLDDYFKEAMGAGLAQVGMMKPFLLTAQIYTKALPCTQPASYELTFVEMAKEAEKTIEGLETLDEQMGFIDSISMEDQIKLLLEAVKEEEEYKKLTTQMVDTYVKQDLDGLLRIMTEQPDMEIYGEDLLDNRNHNWVPKLQELMKEKSLFVAVGAGHLPGEEGVIKLLQEEGYTVEPVMQ